MDDESLKQELFEALASMLGAAGLQVSYGQALCGFLSVLVAPQLVQIMHEPVIISASVYLAPHITDSL